MVTTMAKIKRRFIKEKEAKKLLSEFFKAARIKSEQLPSIKPPIELAEMNGGRIFFINRVPIFAKSDKKLFPTLASGKLLSTLPKVTVDMGAVAYVCNGADIMAPGIVSFEGTFSEEDIVVVSDKRYRKPIAIATAIYNAEDARKLERGKILRNIHYVGDKIWNAIKQLDQTE